MTMFAVMRGFMTHKGVPDFPRSARCILKDYMNVSGMTVACILLSIATFSCQFCVLCNFTGEIPL